MKHVHDHNLIILRKIIEILNGTKHVPSNSTFISFHSIYSNFSLLTLINFQFTKVHRWAFISFVFEFVGSGFIDLSLVKRQILSNQLSLNLTRVQSFAGHFRSITKSLMILRETISGCASVRSIFAKNSNRQQDQTKHLNVTSNREERITEKLAPFEKK